MTDHAWLYLRLAWRNVLRHSRRTAVNLVAVAAGCAALIVFGGFLHSILDFFQDRLIYGRTGHIQLAPAGYWDHRVTRPEAYLIAGYPDLERQLRAMPHVRTLLPRLGVGGLMSAGSTPVAVNGLGVRGLAEAAYFTGVRLTAGHNLDDQDPEGVVLGAGLADTLGVAVGDRVTLTATTIHGAVNALDLRVRGIFVTGMEDYDNRGFRLPLQQAFRLLDTNRPQTVVVGLDQVASLPAFEAALATLPDAQHLEYRTWDQLYPIMSHALTWLSAAFAIVRIIILIIVGLSIINTISQSIRERVGEIGTTLALGTYRRQVLAQFLMEGGILGLLGAAAGVALSLLLAYAVLANGILMPPGPGEASPHKIFIDILPWDIVVSLGLSTVTVLVACCIPAWRAARLSIVEALRDNV